MTAKNKKKLLELQKGLQELSEVELDMSTQEHIEHALAHVKEARTATTGQKPRNTEQVFLSVHYNLYLFNPLEI